jgi:hypothetical protein
MITLSNPFSFIDEMLSELSPEKFYSLMRAAQQMTILEWRDRLEYPGLAARFTGVGNQLRYGFQNRLKSTDRRREKKMDGSDFVFTGGTKRAMMQRKPHSANNKGSKVAVTTFKYGGLGINFLTKINGVVTDEKVRAVDRVAAKAYIQTRHNKEKGTASIVAISGYTMSRPTIHHIVQRSSISYAQEWGNFAGDMAWLQARVPVVFMELARTGVMRDGKLKFRYSKAAHWQLDFGSD